LYTLVVELAILAGLLWKLLGLPDVTAAFLLLFGLLLSFLVYLVFGLLRWIPWMPRKKRDLAQRVPPRVAFLTSLCVLVSLFLILGLSMELRKVAIIGGASKEMAAVARKEGVPAECFDQWFKDSVGRMKSDRLIYAMLLASIVMLGETRCLARPEDGEGPPASGGEKQRN
jgi:hypothetical protein